jgi:Carbohydrate esterase, sialic acid-specific acetylesterase
MAFVPAKQGYGATPYSFLLRQLLMVLTIFVHLSHAELVLPTFLASHMVLQREPLESQVWGWATIGSNVTVTLSASNGSILHEQSLMVVAPTAAATTDHWMVALDEFHTQAADPTTTTSGPWLFKFPAQPSRVDCILTFDEVSADGSESTTILLKDIAFGDVYLCSGQSNMEMSIAAVFNANQEIADSIHYPHLRLATAQRTVADTPQSNVPSKATNYTWARSSPQAMNAQEGFSWFSATCYFFGRTLYQQSNGTVPIGLIASTWGGQLVEVFSSPDALADATCGGLHPISTTTTASPAAVLSPRNQESNNNNSRRRSSNSSNRNDSSIDTTQAMTRRIQQESKHASSVLLTPSNPSSDNDKKASLQQPPQHFSPQDQQGAAQTDYQHHDFHNSHYYNYGTVDPSMMELGITNPAKSQLWNAMIYPFVPMRLAGFVWYQGEANSGNATNYACRFPAMITDWRLKFNLPLAPFVYVSLAAFTNQNDWAAFRASQDAALSLPKVGVALALDLGDPSAPNGAIHPRRKQEVGRRLALTTQAMQSFQEQKEDTTTTTTTKDEIDYYWKGPTLQAVLLVNDTFAIVGFEPGTTTHGMHLHDTGGCTACCQTASSSPFQTMDSNGIWSPALVMHIGYDTVTIAVSSSSSSLQQQQEQEQQQGPIFGIRLHWSNYPECALYNGMGGPDDHQGLPASPVEWCAYPTGQEPWTGKACGTTSPNNNKSNVVLAG